MRLMLTWPSTLNYLHARAWFGPLPAQDQARELVWSRPHKPIAIRLDDGWWSPENVSPDYWRLGWTRCEAPGADGRHVELVIPSDVQVHHGQPSSHGCRACGLPTPTHSRECAFVAAEVLQHPALPWICGACGSLHAIPAWWGPGAVPLLFSCACERPFELRPVWGGPRLRWRVAIYHLSLGGSGPTDVRDLKRRLADLPPHVFGLHDSALWDLDREALSVLLSETSGASEMPSP